MVAFIQDDPGMNLKRTLRFTVLGKSNKETTRHDVTPDNVGRPIRIYRSTAFEQLYGNFLGVDNDYRLTSSIEVD